MWEGSCRHSRFRLWNWGLSLRLKVRVKGLLCGVATFGVQRLARPESLNPKVWALGWGFGFGLLRSLHLPCNHIWGVDVPFLTTPNVVARIGMGTVILTTYHLKFKECNLRIRTRDLVWRLGISGCFEESVFLKLQTLNRDSCWFTHSFCGLGRWWGRVELQTGAPGMGFLHETFGGRGWLHKGGSFVRGSCMRRFGGFLVNASSHM